MTDPATVNRDDLRQLGAELDEAAELGMLPMQSRIEALAQRARAMADASESLHRHHRVEGARKEREAVASWHERMGRPDLARDVRLGDHHEG